MSPDNQKEYLYSVKDLSSYSHTGNFLASEIEQVLNEIGVTKFIGLVSDSASAMKLAKNIIHNRYPSIIILHCIAHQLHLISHDICCLSYISNLISKCNSIVSYFKKSHIAGDLLNNTIKNMLITGGSLKMACKTRWTTYYDCTFSIIRLEQVFIVVRFIKL
jgi:hypothetical protein